MSIINLASNNLIWKRIKILLLSGLLWLIFSIFPIETALAHRPHHVVDRIEVSPNYEQDKTIYILVRNNLFKSIDSGESWRRLVNGLDYRGNLSDLSIAPQDNKILFLSSSFEGIYKSENQGNSWFKVNQGLDTKAIATVIISPFNSKLALATGEEKGLYRTTNEGENWQKVLDKKITAINFIPQENNKILIGDQEGNLYISTDQGQNFTPVANIANSGEITVIAFSPNYSSDKTLLIGTQTGGLYQSQDEGKSITPINQGITDNWVKDIAFSPNYEQDSRIYLAGYSEAVFISENGGQTWQQHNQGIINHNQAYDLKLPHFNEIKFAGNNLYLAGFNSLFRSTDEGNTWKQMETLSGGIITALGISPDYENDSTVIIVTYVGMPYISRNSGETWQVANRGLEWPRFTGNFQEIDLASEDPRRFFHVSVSPNYSSDQTIFASTLWTKLVRSTNGGRSWQIISLPRESRGSTIVPSPNFAEDKTVFVGTQQDNIFKSTDGGSTFSLIGKVGSQFSNDPVSLVISPNFAEDKTVFVTGDEGVYKTVDGGKNWQAITENKPLAKLGHIQLVISPNYQQDKTLIAGTTKGLYITRDGGTTWDKFTNTPYDENGLVEGLAISPNYKNDKTFMVSIWGQGLYKTEDDGQTFRKLGNDNIALAKMNSVPSAGMSIKFSPNYANDNTLYGFGSAMTQVYRSTDGGETWATLDVPLYKEGNYSFLTSLNLKLHIYRGRILRVLLAAIAAFISYFVLGYLRLEKILPLQRTQIKFLGSFTVFLVSLAISLKVL